MIIGCQLSGLKTPPTILDITQRVGSLTTLSQLATYVILGAQPSFLRKIGRVLCHFRPEEAQANSLCYTCDMFWDFTIILYTFRPAGGYKKGGFTVFLYTFLPAGAARLRAWNLFSEVTPLGKPRRKI